MHWKCFSYFLLVVEVQRISKRTSPHNLSRYIIHCICHPVTGNSPCTQRCKQTSHKGCYHHLTPAPLEIPNCSTYRCCNDSTDSSKHRYSWRSSRFSCYVSSSICGGSPVFLLNVNVTYRCLRCRVGLGLVFPLSASLLFLCRLLLLGVVYILCVSTSNSSSTYQNNNCRQLQHRLLLLNK